MGNNVDIKIDFKMDHKDTFFAYLKSLSNDGPAPIKVYVNNGNTVVEWSDGVKTKAGVNDEPFDLEKGVAMAIARRFVSRADFKKLLAESMIQSICV